MSCCSICFTQCQPSALLILSFQLLSKMGRIFSVVGKEASLNAKTKTYWEHPAYFFTSLVLPNRARERRKGSHKKFPSSFYWWSTGPTFITGIQLGRSTSVNVISLDLINPLTSAKVPLDTC